MQIIKVSTTKIHDSLQGLNIVYILSFFGVTTHLLGKTNSIMFNCYLSRNFQTLEITCGRGFIFPNNFSASTNPNGPMAIYFIHFHLFKYNQVCQCSEQVGSQRNLRHRATVKARNSFTWVCMAVQNNGGEDG